jgi:hypothetical protein
LKTPRFSNLLAAGAHSALVQPVGQQKLANIELCIVRHGSTSRFILEKRREQTVHRNARNRNSRSHGRRVARCERVKPHRGHAGTIERLELSTSGLVQVLFSTSVLSLVMRRRYALVKPRYFWPRSCFAWSKSAWMPDLTNRRRTVSLHGSFVPRQPSAKADHISSHDQWRSASPALSKRRRVRGRCGHPGDHFTSWNSS